MDADGTQIVAVTSPRERAELGGRYRRAEADPEACRVPGIVRPEPPRRIADYSPLAFPAVMLTVFFVVPFGIMVMVSFFRRQQGGFYTPDFVLESYGRFLSAFFGGSAELFAGAGGCVALICVVVGFPFTYELARAKRWVQVSWLVALLSVLSLSKDHRLRMVHAAVAHRRHFQPAGLAWHDGQAGGSDTELRRRPDRHGLSGFSLYRAGALSGHGAARPDADGGGADAGIAPLKAFLTVVVPALRNTIVATFIMVFVFALGQPAAAVAWPAAALDAVGADHGSGRLPVEHAVRRGHGRVPGAGDAVAGGIGASGWTEGCGDMSGTLFRRCSVRWWLVPGGAADRDAGVSVNAQRTLVFPPVAFPCAGMVRSSRMRRRGSMTASVVVATLAAALAVCNRFSAVVVLVAAACALGAVFQMLGTAPFVRSCYHRAGVPGVLDHGRRLRAAVDRRGGPRHFFVTLPLVTSLGFASIDRSLVEAASTMGADDRTILRTIVMPLIRPI